MDSTATSPETYLVSSAATESWSREIDVGQTTDPTEAGVVATLTSTETYISVCEEMSYHVGLDYCGDPCPVYETDWIGLAAADLEFTPAVVDPITDPPTALGPQPRPEAARVLLAQVPTAGATGPRTNLALLDLGVWFTGVGAALVPLMPELAVDESVGGFDPCFEYQSSSPLSIRRAMTRK